MQGMLESVTVTTTQGRGMTPTELAGRCVVRIGSVADSAPPVIRDQAVAFRTDVQTLVERYLKEAVRNDRISVYNTLTQAGLHEAAQLVRGT